MAGALNITTIDQAKEFFKNDRFATENGISIVSAENGKSKVHIKLNASHKNAAGGVMGGVMFTMADFACAVAANFASETLYVSADSSISFMNACKGEELFASAECIKAGRRLCFYEVTVTDELGTLVARSRFTMCGC